MLREREWQSLVITRFVESMMETTVINRSLEKKGRNRKREREKETKRNEKIQGKRNE